MKRYKNERGFLYSKFKDTFGITCSVQESSSAEEYRIWIGCDDADPRICVPNKGWKNIVIPGMIVNTHMHLNQEQAAALIPVLKHFVDTGYLPEGEKDDSTE